MAITIEHNPARDVTTRHDSSFSMRWRGDTQSCMTRVLFEIICCPNKLYFFLTEIDFFFHWFTDGKLNAI